MLNIASKLMPVKLYINQCFIQAPFLGGKFPPPNIDTSPQEFSATPAVKLKIMSVLD